MDGKKTKTEGSFQSFHIHLYKWNANFILVPVVRTYKQIYEIVITSYGCDSIRQ